MAKIGIIGGTGLDDPAILERGRDRPIETKLGSPSSPLKEGSIRGVEVAILARHGREHTIPPSQINNRANILALKEAGCTAILATTAVGSLREEIARGDLVIPDQLIDFTRGRVNTFHERFAPHSPLHVSMADPFAQPLREILIEGCRELALTFHASGTVITVEGPRFSTRAESRMFRAWGADIINMSVAPEAALANEAGIPYAVVAMSTDYDCWKEDEPPVSWEQIKVVLAENTDRVTRLLIHVLDRIRS